MMLADRYRTIRRGVTLVELLIVVSIMTILAAIALPAMQTGMESRRIREATRAFHVYLGLAQVRAIELGRPVGVSLMRSEMDPRACILVRQVEIPPPYAGDFDGSVIGVWWDNSVAPAELRAQFEVAMFPVSNGLISPGNKIQFNNQGPYYTIQSPNGTTDFPVDAYGHFDFTTLTNTTPSDKWVDETLTLVVDGNPAFLPWDNTPPDNNTEGVPFQITRNPIPSAVAPFKLSRGMVIDLDDSGYKDDTAVRPPDLRQPAPPYQTMAQDEFAARDLAYDIPAGKDLRPVLVMFGPDGSVERVYHSTFFLPESTTKVPLPQYYGRYVQSTIFFMIGRADRTYDTNDTMYTTPPPDDNLENWQDAGNLWLALNPHTGRMTVAEVNADVENPATGVYVPSNLYMSRALARRAQLSTGGR